MNMKRTFTLAAVALLTAGFCNPADASLAGAAAKAVLKRAITARAAPQAVRAGRSVARSAVGAAKPRDVIVPRSRYPQSAAHIDHAQRMGQPTVLTLDRLKASQRRRESLRYIRRPADSRASGKDRDEYPPALTREGGHNSNVRYIPAGDNRGAGKAIERQVRDLPDGERIRILVTD